jgi:hypothetical protein
MVLTVRFLKVLRWFWALWVGAVRTSISMGEWSLSLYPLSALILDKQRILLYYCQSSTTLLVLFFFFFFFFRLLAGVVTTE